MVGVDARALSSRRRSAIEMSSPTYDRAPSPRLRPLLAPGEFLAPLLATRSLEGIDLEVHLCRKEEVHLYCGLTRLVASGLGTGGKVWVKSHESSGAGSHQVRK